MADLLLTESRQASLRALLAAEPDPGRPLPRKPVLEHLAKLVPCDILDVGFAVGHGGALEHVVLALGPRARGTVIANPWGHAEHGPDDGPFYTGFVHWTPAMAEECGGPMVGVDEVSLGFRNGIDDVVQLGFTREARRFSAEELGLIRFLLPVVARLVRERPAPDLPPSLTVSERRILQHVARGRSNPEIAALLCVAESTVRKHLENTYRKLGVSNRMAAVARLSGAGEAVDLRGSCETFAGTRMGVQESSV